MENGWRSRRESPRGSRKTLHVLNPGSYCYHYLKFRNLFCSLPDKSLSNFCLIPMRTVRSYTILKEPILLQDGSRKLVLLICDGSLLSASCTGERQKLVSLFYPIVLCVFKDTCHVPPIFTSINSPGILNCFIEINFWVLCHLIAVIPKR